MRTYCPVGDLVAGMAYLVRRLLENTSNESLPAPSRRAGVALDELLAPPGRRPPHEAVRQRADPRAAPRARARQARRRARGARRRGRRCACRCGSATTPRRATELVSTDPGKPDRVVAEAAARDARGRRRRARCAAARARGTAPAAERAAVLVRAAQWLRERRLELAALAVRECAKPWPEADADVCEAIDFLEYYARGALDLAQGAPLLQVPGERNELRYARARRRRRDLAVELPAGDPARDGRRRRWPPATPSCSSPPSSRPAARCVLVAGAARGRRARRARSRCCPARATSAPRSCATRACTRSRSPAPTRSASRSCAPRPRRRPARSTSSA